MTLYEVSLWARVILMLAAQLLIFAAFVLLAEHARRRHLARYAKWLRSRRGA